jgi:hypothetical protein
MKQEKFGAWSERVEDMQLNEECLSRRTNKYHLRTEDAKIAGRRGARAANKLR